MKGMIKMNKEEVIQFLNDKGIAYTITEHVPVYTIEEMLENHIPYPETIAKNLFIRDDKKKNYYLVSVREDKRVNLKQFQEAHGTRRLSFASEGDLEKILGLSKGAVTPLGLLNDTEKITHFYLDRDLTGGDISVHPNENTATVKMKTADLLKLIEENGSEIHIVEM